ncbi:MAG: hypothetical protein DWQ36_05665 [Acidobacteria bacterium]|nr:MAG: hypothetical protein DWQ30_08220 [Acidobacteriota bacterium]REK09750.1 MAG: hypothetical protein DWQ36_05665 [Acidobacteriota bacterium]
MSLSTAVATVPARPTRPLTATGRLTLLLLVALALLGASSAHAWGKNGHRVTAEIAERHLSDEARDAVRQVTGGLALWQTSTWADFVRSEDPWRIANTWHYVTVEDESQVDEALSRTCAEPPCGVIAAIEFFAAVLRDDGPQRQRFAARTQEVGAQHYDGSLELSALALLVHFVGDIHQPLHVGRGDDQGGNQIAVNWFGEVSNLHSVWDSGLIDHEQLSFTEMSDGLLAALGDEPVEQGDAAAWAREAKQVRSRVYRIWDRTSRDNRLPDLGWQYVHDMRPLVDRQLYRAGRRLAGLLEQIYGGH